MQQLLTDKIRLSRFEGEWEKKLIGDLLAYERPDRYIVASTSYSNQGDIPVLTANKAFILGYTTETFGVCTNLPAIVFDDFTTDNKFATVPFKVKSSAIKLLRPKNDRMSLRFLFELMQIVRFPVGEHKRHYISDYQNIELRVPEYSEQLAIVSILSDIDAEIAALESQNKKMQYLKQAVMQQLLTGKTRLPGFCGKWKISRLSKYVTFLRNGANSRAELLPEGRVKYLHYGDVHASKDVYISTVSLPYLPTAKAKSLDRLQDGDLIFVDASEDIVGVSKSVEVRDVGNDEFVSGLHTIAARFDKKVLADGFKGYLQFCPPFVNKLRRLAAGTKVYSTNRSHIASVEMPLPSIPEQAAIATVLSDMDSEIAALEARLGKTRYLKQAMMQELLTGKTRLATPGASNA